MDDFGARFRFGLVDCDRSDCDRCGGDGSTNCNLYVDDSTGDWTGDWTGDSTSVSRMTGSIGGDVLFIVSCRPTFLSNSQSLVVLCHHVCGRTVTV